MIAGRPMSASAACRSCESSSVTVTPWRIGTPLAAMISFEVTLSPMLRIAAGGGPMKVSPAATQASAKSAFSDRKPYPGCTASAPDLGRGLEDETGDEVGVGGCGALEAHCLVGLLHEQRVGVGVGVDDRGPDAEFAGGADNAAGDLAAVGDEDLVDRGIEDLSLLERSWRGGRYMRKTP